MVFVHPDNVAVIDIVRAAAEDEFKAPSRYVPKDQVSRYSRAIFQALANDWDLTLDDEAALSDAAYAEGEDRQAGEADQA
jgi:hypothetical protein